MQNHLLTLGIFQWTEDFQRQTSGPVLRASVVSLALEQRFINIHDWGENFRSFLKESSTNREGDPLKLVAKAKKNQ